MVRVGEDVFEVATVKSYIGHATVSTFYAASRK